MYQEFGFRKSFGDSIYLGVAGFVPGFSHTFFCTSLFVVLLFNREYNKS